MKIHYIGNQTAGLIGKLTVLSQGHEIVDNINGCDILLCVHGRKIIPRNIFSLPKIASINIHPYLYAYKGADPIGRAIYAKNWKASVGCHHISEDVDNGKLIYEQYCDVIPSDNRADIYNQLYPIYSDVIIKSLNMLEEEYMENLKYFINLV